MRYTENTQNEFVLGVAFLVLGMIYTTIFCFGFVRFCKMGKSTKYLGGTFYFSIVLSCLAYMVNIGLYLYKIFDTSNDENDQDNIIEKQLLNTIYVPDCLFWIVYQSLFWTVVCLHYDSRLHMGQISDLPYNPNKLIHRLKDIFIIYGIASLILVLLFNFDYLSSNILVYVDIAINLSIPLQFIITSLYLQCKYSGSPFKSSRFENKANRLQKLIIFWTIMRLIQVFSNFLLTNNKELIQKFLTSNLTQNQLLLYVSILIVDLLLTNIIPFILALRQQAVSIFGGSSNVTASMVSEQPLRQQFLNDDSSVLDTKQISFSFKDLEKQGLQQQEQKKKENSFGILMKCNIKGKVYGLRIIEYQQIQQYLIEQVKQEVEQINSLRHQYLYHIHGLDFTENKIIYLVKYYQNSLHEYLKQHQISEEEKIELLIQLLRGLSYLNCQNIYHGSLTTKNIMINKNGRVKIVDFGIYGIKKYLSLTQGYTNKSGFTAPELLCQKGQIVNGTTQGDVYSVGMIMYEMFEKKVPFEGLSIQNLQECMNKSIRPKIETKSMMVDIIRWCWQQELDKRPKIDYGSIVVGSNIYKAEFTDDIYVYYGNQVHNTIYFRDGLIISPKKLDLPEYKFNRSERAEIIQAILKEAINYLEYSKISEMRVINMFEQQFVSYSNLKSYPTLQFQLLDSDSPSVLLDVRKFYFSLHNCHQIIKSLNTDPNTYFKNKYVMVRYPSKQMIVKIKSVVFDQEFTYKNKSLEEYFADKYQIVSKTNVYLETYNTDKIKNQFLIAEFCDLKVDYIESDISSYCSQLEYWNKVINNSSQFLNFLNQYKLIICGEIQEFKINYLEASNLVLNNNNIKSLYQIVTSRTSNEFEYFYSDLFLKNPTTFTTSLTVPKLLIFVQRDIIESRENFRNFLEKLEYFIKSRAYKISQPQIFDINNNLNELLEKYVTPDSYIFLIGDPSHEFQQARNNLLQQGIPNQIIILPIQDSEMNRLLAMMTANLGSVPWSVKEINGFVNNKKTSVLGIYKNEDTISACLSINKYFNKYISSFGNFDETITYLLATYYATHKILADQIIVFADQDYSQQIEQKILDVISLIREQGLAQQIVKPEIIMVQVNDAEHERYFTYINYFDPYYCKNPSVGNLVAINEKQGRFSIHTQRGEQGCLQAQKLQVHAQNPKEICQLYYQLIFLCFDLSSSTYLPAPLHYAKKLSKFQLQSETYKKAIQKGQMLFV